MEYNLQVVADRIEAKKDRMTVITYVGEELFNVLVYNEQQDYRYEALLPEELYKLYKGRFTDADMETVLERITL